jgi:hypothetical protein
MRQGVAAVAAGSVVASTVVSVSAERIDPAKAFRACQAAIRVKMPKDVQIPEYDGKAAHPNLRRLNLSGLLFSGGRRYRYVCKVGYDGFVLHDQGLLIVPWGQ